MDIVLDKNSLFLYCQHYKIISINESVMSGRSVKKKKLSTKLSNLVFKKDQIFFLQNSLKSFPSSKTFWKLSCKMSAPSHVSRIRFKRVLFYFSFVKPLVFISWSNCLYQGVMNTDYWLGLAEGSMVWWLLLQSLLLI